MLKNYFKIALKGLVKHRYYTSVSLFGITMTLIVLTISVALINHQLTLGKPGSRLDRSLLVDHVEAEFKDGSIGSLPNYRMLDRYVRNLKEAEAVSIYSRTSDIVVYADNKRIQSTMKRTDATFWDIADFTFIEGMPYNQETVDKAGMVAVMNDQAEQAIFGDQSALGQYLETSEGTFRIVGIIPYREISTAETSADIYVPITTSTSIMNNNQLWGSCHAFVQVADKSQFAAAKQEFQTHMDQVYKDYQAELELTMFACYLRTPVESVAADMNQSELIYYGGIIGIMILFMFMPAINLTLINFSRVVERYPEIGIRKAFGASSSALMGQFIIENIIITLIGGLIAYVLSLIILIFINNSGIVPWGYIALDTRVFIYCMVIAIFFGIFSGILPSYRMSRLHPAIALKGVNR
jgi:putative ABC transport system permease protein